MLMTSMHSLRSACSWHALLNLVLCRSAVDAEFRKNKELGERLGCWKGSYLVEDDGGSVRKALQELQQPTAEQNADQL